MWGFERRLIGVYSKYMLLQAAVNERKKESSFEIFLRKNSGAELEAFESEVNETREEVTTETKAFSNADLTVCFYQHISRENPSVSIPLFQILTA